MEKMMNSERGQAIILLALAIAGLLAFTALALDGAMVYSDRRTGQNGADAASNAGAGAAGANLRYRGVDREEWTCSDNGTPAYGYILEARTKALAAATGRAADNGYQDGAGDNQVTVSTVCSTGATDEEKYLDVEVEITTPSRPSLIHMFYKGPLVNTVTSVSRVRPGYKSGIFEGNAIVALNPDDKDVINLGGSGPHQHTHVHGGGVYDNSSHSGRAFRQHGGGEITVDPPGAINVVGGTNIQDPDNVDATVNTGVAQTPFPEGVPTVTPPTCASAASVSGNRVSPGWWSGKFPPNGVEELGDPASDDTKIFCITSGDLDVTNGVLTGHNVMIYLADGDVKWNGGDLHLDAPDDGDYAGLLIYVDPNNYAGLGNDGNHDVTINGNIASTIEGTVFAPSSRCKINGTSDSTAFRAQFICYMVDLSGGGEFHITYDPEDNYKEVAPPNMEVKK